MCISIYAATKIAAYKNSWSDCIHGPAGGGGGVFEDGLVE